MIQHGYLCNATLCHVSTCIEVCGNRIRTHKESCDDGNTIMHDGCSSECTVECGYTCDMEEPNACTSDCGDSILSNNEVCDDGGASEGCLDDCSGEQHGWDCDNTACGLSECYEVCGNGVRTSGEVCDDGNTAEGDGCSSECTVECGYTCDMEEPNACTSECGDSILSNNEVSDDGEPKSDE